MHAGLALFDFDGTITTRDSFLEMLRFSHPASVFLRNMALSSPIIAAYKLKLVSNHRAKEHLFSSFYKGWAQQDFSQMARSLSEKVIVKLIRPEALSKIQWHLAEGHQVVVVSASFELQLAPWCEALGLELIGTRLVVSGGMLTGKLEGANCHGEEKVARIRQRYDLNSYRRIYAYGDTSGDKPMLKLAHEAFYKPFRS
jgi:HAD superfamily hydrolase (TIGR01490 family)